MTMRNLLTIAIIATLILFLKQSWSSHQQTRIGTANNRQAFDPSRTDVLNYSEGLRFAKENQDPGLYVSLTWWKVIQLYLWPNRIQEFTHGITDHDDEKTISESDRIPTIDIWDARKHLPDASLDTNGFVLMNLGEDHYEPTNWDDKDQVDHFHEHVVLPRLENMFPHATRFETTKRIIRGRRFGPTPATGVIHTDFSLDSQENDRFIDLYGKERLDGKYSMMKAVKESEWYKNNQTVYKETHEDVLEAIVTIWKPIERSTPVCDKPLMFMDASTYPEKDERQYHLHFHLWPFYVEHSLNALPVYRPEYQMWYYYPFMTTDEAVLFVQHNSTKGFHRVAHASFNNDNCPPNTEPRHSIDYRIMVYTKDL